LTPTAAQNLGSRLSGFITSKEAHLTNLDNNYMRRAIKIALDSERACNPPVGALIVLGDSVIAEGASSIIAPRYDPGRHAEIEALRRVPSGLWLRCREMTCYTTLEPCLMCFGSLLLHGVGRIVFGAVDREGGAHSILDHLPNYYAGGGVPEWVGPILSDECDPLYERVKALFDRLPCGRAYSPE
jgi:tRNA(adenine34) deaminase